MQHLQSISHLLNAFDDCVDAWASPFFLFKAENVSLLSFAGCHHLHRHHHRHYISTIYSLGNHFLLFYSSISAFFLLRYTSCTTSEKIPICLCLRSKVLSFTLNMTIATSVLPHTTVYIRRLAHPFRNYLSSAF